MGYFKNGPEYESTIYLKTSENENDPAGKFNMDMAKFKTNNGCHVRFLVNENDNDVVYPAFEDRYKGDKIIDMESPDFFSRFKVTLGPLLPIEYTKKE